MHFLLRIVVFFIFYVSLVHSSKIKIKYYAKEEISKTITVDKSGKGDFTSVQQAINSVPSNNSRWTRIYVKAGIYNEKVIIPKDKIRIFLDGEYSGTTIIQWGDYGSSIESSTFKLLADYFVARNIQFKNTYDQANGNPITWAPAALIQGDKASFYNCRFHSLQDTLADSQGRHYFYNCIIEGATDFIWGNSRSIYQKCLIYVVASRLGNKPGYITAQGRRSENDKSGFVFLYCAVNGTGTTYLGRAWNAYSTVLFYKSFLANIIVPQGWSAWNHADKVNLITFSEVDCNGPGADMSKRVPWEKKLSPEYLKWLTNTSTFINTDGWLDRQPKFP